MTTADGQNIYQKLVAVRKQVTGVNKDAQTQSAGRFKYVSSNNILSELRPLMDEQGLLLECRVLSHNLLDKWRGASGQNEHMTELEVEFVWVNADKPEEKIVCPFYGQGLDTGEKGVGKALTYAEKYFLLKFFNIPTDEDDPDRGSNGNGHSNGNGKTRQSDVQQAQYDQRGEPANAAAERHAQTPPDPESIVDFNTFAGAMLSIGVDNEEKMKAAKIAAGYAEDKLKSLDATAWQNIYAVAKAAKEAAA